MKSPIRNTLLLGVLLGLAIGLGGYTFIYSKGYSYLTNNPAACANCHVMRAQYDAWLKSSHHSAATCNDCHTPHNIFGKYAVKANNGFWHSFYFTTGWYPDTIEITRFDHRVTENACRRCHQNITAAIDGAEYRRSLTAYQKQSADPRWHQLRADHRGTETQRNPVFLFLSIFCGPPCFRGEGL
jgi:cytochrome c nitrite reductase small subunit